MHGCHFRSARRALFASVLSGTLFVSGCRSFRTNPPGTSHGLFKATNPNDLQYLDNLAYELYVSAKIMSNSVNIVKIRLSQEEPGHADEILNSAIKAYTDAIDSIQKGSRVVQKRSILEPASAWGGTE